MREFEGTLKHQNDDTLGIFVSQMGFTKQSLQDLQASSYPLIYSTIQNGILKQFLMNQAAQMLIPKLIVIQKEKIELFYNGVPLCV